MTPGIRTLLTTIIALLPALFFPLLAHVAAADTIIVVPDDYYHDHPATHNNTDNGSDDNGRRDNGLYQPAQTHYNRRAYNHSPGDRR